jgi:hypothetical protein
MKNSPLSNTLPGCLIEAGKLAVSFVMGLALLIWLIAKRAMNEH